MMERLENLLFLFDIKLPEIKIKARWSDVMTITKKAPNIGMIHLFSSNFLFGWMMEHCREDKLSLVESPGRALTNGTRKP